LIVDKSRSSFSDLFMDPANTLFWNVRGLNGAARRDVVRSLVVASKIDVVCIQETKMEDISRILVIQMLGQEFSTTSSCLRSVLGGGGGVPSCMAQSLGRS
jgi:hypothetical protein